MNNVTQQLGAEDLINDDHARKYLDQLDKHPLAFERLFALLNDPANEQRLIDAESYGKPALAGVVRFIEEEPAIAAVLDEPSGLRFRQTVGVAIKLKMAKLGWQKTGKKGTVTGAHYFVRAERYAKQDETERGYTSKALAALEAVAQIGDEQEQDETGRIVTAALMRTRTPSIPLSSFVEEWNAEAGFVDEDAVAAMAERYGL